MPSCACAALAPKGVDEGDDRVTASLDLDVAAPRRHVAAPACRRLARQRRAASGGDGGAARHARGAGGRRLARLERLARRRHRLHTRRPFAGQHAEAVHLRRRLATGCAASGRVAQRQSRSDRHHRQCRWPVSRPVAGTAGAGEFAQRAGRRGAAPARHRHRLRGALHARSARPRCRRRQFWAVAGDRRVADAHR